MRKNFVGLIFIFVLAFSISAQTDEAKQIDEFGIPPCGDMLARSDWIYSNLQSSPDSKIYVIYYGGRFRKERIWDKRTKSYNKIQLEYPHRDDALNRAKAIPFYLTTEKSFSTVERNTLKDKVVLINGGFRQNIEMEIWIVPQNAAPPKPSPTVDEKDIKFRTDKPFGIPDIKRCYDAY